MPADGTPPKSKMNREVPDKYKLTNGSVEFRPGTPLNMAAVSLRLANGVAAAKLILKLLFCYPRMQHLGMIIHSSPFCDSTTALRHTS